ncbi:uncharacterized protein METZ01_LOCUS228711 [marine metagenome]|uniref:Uncharacterized protein n=1 Tax=marine metagenome TaxID=408172 RepID=A0A382GMH8_9ZZZZ
MYKHILSKNLDNEHKIQKYEILLMSKWILVFLITFICYSPIYASEISNQARDDIESIIYKAINRSGLNSTHVVGIVSSKTQENVHRTKIYGLVEESMEAIFASRSRLADRDRLKEIEKEMNLIQEKGKAAFEGLPVGVLEGIDFFVWSNVKQISQDTVNVKISILDIKSGIVKGVASGEVRIDDILMLGIDVNVENYSKWKEEYQSAIFWRKTGMWVTIGSTAGLFISNATREACPDYQEKGYEKEADCQNVESPTGTLFFSAFLGGIIAGGTIWWMYDDKEIAMKETGIKKNYPLSLSFFPSNNEISLSVTYNF